MNIHISCTALLAAAALIMTGACSNSNSENPDQPATPSGLPKVTSFVLASDVQGIESRLGLNTLSYDSVGRVTRHVNKFFDETLTYSGDKCSVVQIYKPDNAVIQSCEVEFNSLHNATVEHFDYGAGSNKGVINYTYNDKGRIIKEVCDGDNPGYTFHMSTEFTYDDATGLISKMHHVRHIGDTRCDQELTFFYTDKANPVAFYPEAMEIYAFDESLSLCGQTGYSHDKLIDHIDTYDKHTGVKARFVFSYDYDAEGRLTAIRQKYFDVPQNGGEPEKYLTYDFTELKY